MNHKEQLSRFRAWQQTPTQYPDISPEEHTCANCGHHFHGNYCPLCSQQAGDARISWQWVRKSILDVWGLYSRSLPRTLLQLLYRPGHLISDYLSGHRQSCYNPVNMLFIVALFYIILHQLLGWHYTITPDDILGNSFLDTVVPWLSKNPAWGAISLTVMMIIPTWILFRFAPRHARHTLPEGIIIQLFMTSLMLICNFFFNISPWLFFLFLVYYYIAYRQLFGYRPWGTIWRILLCFIVWTIIFFATVVLIYIGTSLPERLPRTLLRVAILLLLAAALLSIGYFIGKKTARRRQETAL